MKLTDFSTLTFDVAGTLIDFETGILNWIRPHLEKLGITKNEEEVLHSFARTEEYFLQILPESSFTEILPVIYSDMMRNWGESPREEDGVEFQNSVCEWPAFPDTVKALKELKKHYRLVAVTNSDSHYLHYMSEKMEDPFDECFTCDQFGVNKPDQRLFKEILKRLQVKGVSQHEILHVAQSQFHDIIPVSALGWASVWIHRRYNQPGYGATPEPYKMVKPVFTAKSMEDLVQQVLRQQQVELRQRNGTFSLKVIFS